MIRQQLGLCCRQFYKRLFAVRNVAAHQKSAGDSNSGDTDAAAGVVVRVTRLERQGWRVS